MTIQFIPLGIPFSSSFSLKSKYTLNTSLGGFPVTAAYAEFSTSSVGPSGSLAVTVSGSIIAKSI